MNSINVKPRDFPDFVLAALIILCIPVLHISCVLLSIAHCYRILLVEMERLQALSRVKTHTASWTVWGWNLVFEKTAFVQFLKSVEVNWCLNEKTFLFSLIQCSYSNLKQGKHFYSETKGNWITILSANTNRTAMRGVHRQAAQCFALGQKWSMERSCGEDITTWQKWPIKNNFAKSCYFLYCYK